MRDGYCPLELTQLDMIPYLEGILRRGMLDFVVENNET